MRFIQTIYTIWQREIIRYLRDKTQIISILFQSLMLLVISGAGLRQMFTLNNFGVNSIQFLYPGIMAIGVAAVAFFSTVSTVWDREFGFLKEIQVAPVSRIAVALGKTLGATTIASFQGLISLALAPIIGVNLSFVSIPKIILFLILFAFAISGMGFFIASFIKTTESFGLLMQVIISPMLFISGAFFPLTNVPQWMKIIANINPLAYGVDVLRQIILNNQVTDNISNNLFLHSISTNILFLIIFSIIMVGAAVSAFDKKE